MQRAKEKSEDSNIIMDCKSVSDSFAKQMIKLLHSKGTPAVVMTALKEVMPKIGNGNIIPKECYYDEEDNALNIFFDINAAKPYSVAVVVTNTDSKTGYDFTMNANVKLLSSVKLNSAV